MAKTNMQRFSLLLFASLAILLLQPAANAACGTTYLNSGICTGGYVSVNCGGLGGKACCEEVPGCEWECFGGDCVCISGGGSYKVECEDYNDNEAACTTFGCTWEQQAGIGACSGSPTGKGYGVACSSNSECATCLVCDPDLDKCTQKEGVCTTIPAEYVPPPPDPAVPGQGTTPKTSIENLEGGTGNSVVPTTSGFYQAGWFSDWKTTGLIGVAIVCFIIALAAMMGKAFNLPEVKAFANNEMKQAVISVLLIASLIALVTFFHEVALEAINAADLPIACNNFEPCYVSSAKYYLTTLYDTGNDYAKEQLKESIVNAKRANYGYNLNLNKIYLLFLGMSIRFNAGDSLVAERHGALFSQTSKIMSSIYAQKYFIDVVTFGIAPLFILLGIVLRTFFFTRKLGGLMLAIAISLFIVYPLTFAFAWYTLNVTVYGERTLAVADPACPGECTGTYPVAFFTDSPSGQLIQFQTTQSILRAGITSDNWDDGGPNGEFPGLVACRELATINLPNVNSCAGCPDYCRDVPFNGMPGCDIAACAECNPGCKIVRQRLNCQTDPACEGKCPIVCRTQIPLENKCFSDEEGGVIPANLSTSCEGCSKYPNWCRMLRKEKDAGGNYVYVPAYDDAACKDAGNGVDVSNDPSCPMGCSYITSLGIDTSCDTICSYTVEQVKTICPAQCRVTELYDNGWASTYDLNPPGLAIFCSETPERAEACRICSTHEECLIGVLEDPPDTCAPYPTTNPTPEKCLDCPEYCRREDFTGFFETYSNVPRAASGLPNVCNQQIVPGIACSPTGTPVACDESCRTTEEPLICRPYDSNHGTDVARCKGCPDNARYEVKYTKIGPAGCLTCDPNCLPAATEAPAGEYTAILSGKARGGKHSGSENYARAIWLGSGGTILLGGNTPYILESYILPATAYESTPLNGYCKGTIITGSGLPSDAAEEDTIHFMDGTYRLDANSFTYKFKWHKNGVFDHEGEYGCETSSCPIGIAVPVDAINNPQAGDTWQLYCKAVLGVQETDWLLSAPPVTIRTGPPEPACTATQVSIMFATDPIDYHCSAADCPAICQKSDPIYVVLPNEINNPDCNDASVTDCPYGCRIKGATARSFADFLDPTCAVLCADLPDYCKVGGAPTAPFPSLPLCSEFLGNGPASCHSQTCLSFKTPGDCAAASTAGCAWSSSFGICDSVSCTSRTEATCAQDQNCKMMNTYNIVTIENRAGVYDNRYSCRQCPEQCRIDGYEGKCGVDNNGNDVYVDCSEESCSLACRFEVPTPEENGVCQEFPEGTGTSCLGCPALCRRHSDLLSSTEGCDAYPSCVLDPDPEKGCLDSCRLDDPPDKACEGCFDCDMDCTYYPAIRSDCSDICSDEALAGPVNIMPNDFIKSLPGAATSTAGLGPKNIGVLFIPAIVLPLFCIVIVVAFIRVLSPVLGGDIELPGLGRII